MGQTPTIANDGATDAGAGAPPSNADRHMLIDGELVGAERTFASVNPATGEVFGHAPEGTVANAEAAVAAARRAFDDGPWATDVALRIRCLEQFHQALLANRDELAALTIAEVGATPALLAGAQLDGPIDIVRYYGELLKTFPMTEDLGNIESRGMQAPPLGGEGRRRRRRRDRRLQLPQPTRARQARAPRSRRDAPSCSRAHPTPLWSPSPSASSSPSTPTFPPAWSTC